MCWIMTTIIIACSNLSMGSMLVLFSVGVHWWTSLDDHVANRASSLKFELNTYGVTAIKSLGHLF